MKGIKKLVIVLLFAAFGVMMFGVSKLSATEMQETPWHFTFDHLEMDIVEEQPSFVVHSNKVMITYNDTTGETDGAYFDLFYQRMILEVYEAFYYQKWIANGETIVVDGVGGPLWFRTTDLNVTFTMHRSLIKKLHTNYYSSQFYYNNEVYFYFSDDYPWDFNELEIYWNNITTNEHGYGNDFTPVSLEKSGYYQVQIIDHINGEQLNIEFIIDKTKPMIYVEEYIYGEEPKQILNYGTTWAGAKVIFGDNIAVKNMKYTLYTPNGDVITGSVESEFIFWRKGRYVIEVTDMAGNKEVTNFTITSYSLLLDPATAAPYIGTEVTVNGGQYGGTTIKRGYTRCIYLDANAPSQSRLDYHFTSSDESIAKVSAYGTITAVAPGVVTIYVVHKNNPSLQSQVTITVLP